MKDSDGQQCRDSAGRNTAENAEDAETRLGEIPQRTQRTQRETMARSGAIASQSWYYAPGWATTLSRQECRRSGGSPIALDSLAPPRGPINGRGRSLISCKPWPKAPEDWRSPRRWRDYEHAPPEAREVLDCASPLALSVVQQAEMRLTGGEAPVRCLPVAF